MSTDSSPEWEFKERDLYILRELSADPQRSSRDIVSLLDEKYDISTSHVTVSESIRRMREEGVFREAVIPHEAYFNFALFEFKFDASNFEEGWRETMDAIREDRHTLFYFLSDGEYQWKSVMMFPSREAESRWIHDFYKEHGDVVQNVRNSMVHNVLKFQTDPAMFTELLECECRDSDA